MQSDKVNCPVCSKPVPHAFINKHIDSNCQAYLQTESNNSFLKAFGKKEKPSSTSTFATRIASSPPNTQTIPLKRSPSDHRSQESKPDTVNSFENGNTDSQPPKPPPVEVVHPLKRPKLDEQKAFQKAAPLAERMRPTSLDDVFGQDLVGPNGILRGLIEEDRVPSMILWGGPGSGKTTIARIIAKMSGSRFVEINSTSSGVAECKKLFADAKADLLRHDRRTIIFCDEIHRFSKSQQDVFLGPVESGQIVLIAATTENPSFKVQNALLSRCRTFTLQKLTDKDITGILNRCLESPDIPAFSPKLLDQKFVEYLAAFADGDSRTALNLLELSLSLSIRAGMTQEMLKKALTRTLVYDRAGDSHYDAISALHKSLRGSDADAALYYLALMLRAGENPLFIARRLVVFASEDIGLADNSMLSLATAAYTACEKIGMPECRINLAHAVVALAQSPKSVKSYRAYQAAEKALTEVSARGNGPGTAEIPMHLRNAPTRLMKDNGYGKGYKYNPDFMDGKVVQEYLPSALKGRSFVEDLDLGTIYDSDLDDD
jgi:putative ATPase